MEPAFDPYHKWLGIPPAEQPPTKYRLLGLSPFEQDQQVIHAGADRAMAHLKQKALGQYVSIAEKLLGEVAAARADLTDPQHRAMYDTVLKGAVPADTAMVVEGDAQQPATPDAQATSSQDSSPKMFGEFELKQRLRRSRLGDVYKARHERSGRHFSLKLLRGESAKDHQILGRFRREQEIVVKLQHPNLISGIEAGAYQGASYLVTEFVVGSDLATLVSRRGPLPIERAIDYTIQAASGLAQLHQHGVFHRNIKPHVLLIDVQGQVKVTNLFLAKIGDSTDLNDEENLTRTGQMMGTADYLAPEQAMDARSVDHRADIYSLGCTLHYLITGEPPYPVKSTIKKIAAHRKSPIPSLRKARKDVPSRIDRTFGQMLAKDPAQRFASMHDVIRELSGNGASPSLWQRIRGAIGSK